MFRNVVKIILQFISGQKTVSGVLKRGIMLILHFVPQTDWGVVHSGYATEQILLSITTSNKTHCSQKQQKYHHHFVNTIKDD